MAKVLSDAVLAIKGGSNAYNAVGGSLAGTWTPQSFPLTYQHIPVHATSHSYTKINYGRYAGGQLGGAIAWYTDNDTMTNLNSGTSGSGNTHTHGTNAYRPQGAVGIIVQYDGE